MIRILVVGELCEDNFIYGDCKRLSPEAPIPVMIPVETIINDGMAGNVVRNLESLSNDLIIQLWHQSERITKTRFVDKKSNHMFLRLDSGEDKVTPMIHSMEKFDEIRNQDIVIVSDYDKGLLDEQWLKFLGKFAKLSILDSKRKLTKDIVDSYNFVKLNEKEFQLNSELSDCKNIITTLGSQGAKYRGVLYPSPSPKETIDVSGAGDTFTASFILKYHLTQDISESLKFANEMSSIVVSKRGVSILM